MLLSHALLLCLAFQPVSPPADANVYTVQHRAFRVPVQIESRRAEIEQIVLFVSIDQGKTWKEAGAIGPDEDSFRYVAPADGSYWFAVQIALKNKTKEPAEVDNSNRLLKLPSRRQRSWNGRRLWPSSTRK